MNSRPQLGVGQYEEFTSARLGSLAVRQYQICVQSKDPGPDPEV